MKNNIFKIILLLSFIIAGTTDLLRAQEKNAVLGTSDVIIMTDGQIIYGKVLEIDANSLKYRKGDAKEGVIITIPVSRVYAVSFADKTTQIITPILGNQKTGSGVAGQNPKGDSIKQEVSGIKANIGHGTLKIGAGFESAYSDVEGIKTFDKGTGSPSLYLGYSFKYNRLFDAGISLGFADKDYQKSTFSDYDNIDFNQKINEKVLTVGLFGKYNLTAGFIKPYLLGGINFNYTYISQEGDIFYRDQEKHVLTNFQIRGVKTELMVRAGLDVNISRRFGFFADAGLGVSLIQVGVNFIFL
jgi:opacity protein-like surface antigen